MASGERNTSRASAVSELVKKWGGRGDFILIFPIAHTEYPNSPGTSDDMVDITVITNCSKETVAKVVGHLAKKTLANIDPFGSQRGQDEPTH